MCFRNNVLQKTRLDKSPKSPVLEDALRSNIVSGAKHC